MFIVLLIEGSLKILPKPKQNVFLHSSTPSGKDVYGILSYLNWEHTSLLVFSLVCAECLTVITTNVILAVERSDAVYVRVRCFPPVDSVLIWQLTAGGPSVQQRLVHENFAHL